MKIGILVEIYHDVSLVGEGILRYLAPIIDELTKAGHQIVFYSPPIFARSCKEYIGVYYEKNPNVSYFTDAMPNNGTARVSASELFRDPFPVIHKRRSLAMKLLLLNIAILLKLPVRLYSALLAWTFRNHHLSIKRAISAHSPTSQPQSAPPSLVDIRACLSAINTSDLDVVFLTSPQYSGMQHISKPKALLFPDCVFFAYPRDWPFSEQDMMVRLFKHGIKCADSIITYSKHVTNEHLLKMAPDLQIQPFVVPHGVFIESTRNCASLLDLTVHLNTAFPQLIRKFTPGRDRYVLISSQDRPHKNFPRLLAALSKLLEEYPDLLFVFTAKHFLKSTQAAIKELGLEHRVVQTHSLPEAIHNALAKHAFVGICPSYFEGGLTSIFSEFVSLGTPVVLSRIPAFLEHIPAEAHPEFYFDPYSTSEIARSIGNVIQNRERILSEQKEVLNRLSTGLPWKALSERYLAAFSDAVRHATSRESQSRQ